MTQDDSNSAPKTSSKEAQDNTALCVLTHILGIFIGILGSLIIYFATSQRDVKEHAKNALNWHLSVIIYVIFLVILMIISILLFRIDTSIYSIIGVGIMVLFFILAILLYILGLIFSIIAAIKAGEGHTWKYPLSITFLK
ncbi:MAG: DUF4870 domain-containing protein [Candidatus Woesearchaeota archaeon]